MSVIFECKGLTKRFGPVTALDRVDLTLETGRIVGLLGPNGSGKTTLLKLANGLLKPTEGEILINGLKPGPATKSFVSYLPDGNEIIYNSLKEGEIFGNNLVFSSEPYYKGNITAIEDALIGLLQKEDLLSILETNKDFLLEYLRIQSNFSKELNNRIRLLSLESAEERFLYYMHIHRNTITFRSISDLAKQLYLKRETLSRLISRFQKEKRIIRDDKTITLL